VGGGRAADAWLVILECNSNIHFAPEVLLVPLDKKLRHGRQGVPWMVCLSRAMETQSGASFRFDAMPFMLFFLDFRALAALAAS